MERLRMRPGTIFICDDRRNVRGIEIGCVRTLVVLDPIFELDFWTGQKSALGDVCAGVSFQVL